MLFAPDLQPGLWLVLATTDWLWVEGSVSRQCLDGVASLCVVPSRVCSVTRFFESISEEPEVESSLLSCLRETICLWLDPVIDPSVIYIHRSIFTSIVWSGLRSFICWSSLCISFSFDSSPFSLLVSFLPYGTPCRSCYVTRARLAYTKIPETPFSIPPTPPATLKAYLDNLCFDT